MTERIFLIGFMGSGKSTFGKKLARSLGYTFIDSDLEIQKESEMSIEELFREIGEEGFRKLETDWLGRLDQTKVVIALGGGTPCFNNNMETILEYGTCFYLRLTPETLARRLEKSSTIRPLIEKFRNDSESLDRFITEKLSEREPFYQLADHTLSGRAITVENVIASLNDD